MSVGVAVGVGVGVGVLVGVGVCVGVGVNVGGIGVAVAPQNSVVQTIKICENRSKWANGIGIN